MSAKTLPVILVNGFPNGGKTQYITDFYLPQTYTSSEKILLISCEKGIENYGIWEEFSSIKLIQIEDQSHFNKDELEKLAKQYMPDKVIIEANGMWNYGDIVLALPSDWKIEKRVSLIELQTFSRLFENNTALMTEKIQHADSVIFNRCAGQAVEDVRARDLRAINPEAEISLMFLSGKTEPYEK